MCLEMSLRYQIYSCRWHEDGNVLGFDTIPQPTYKDRDLREVVAHGESERPKVSRI